MAWPRVKIELVEFEVVVPFNPNTLATIEREVGLSSMEFAAKFSDQSRAPIFDLGMKIILGAIRSVRPEFSSEMLGEKIKPGTFLAIFQSVADAWIAGVGMAAGPVVEAMTEDPRVAGVDSRSST